MTVMRKTNIFERGKPVIGGFRPRLKEDCTGGVQRLVKERKTVFYLVEWDKNGIRSEL